MKDVTQFNDTHFSFEFYLYFFLSLVVSSVAGLQILPLKGTPRPARPWTNFTGHIRHILNRIFRGFQAQ